MDHALPHPWRSGSLMLFTASERMSRWMPHPSVVGATMLGLAPVVLVVTGIHASALGQDPAWAFDCNDTTCVDLWREPRMHYRMIALACCGAVLSGWIVTGLDLSTTQTVRERRHRSRPRALSLSTCLVLLGAPICSAVAGSVLAAASIPIGLAGGVVPALAAGIMAWNSLRVEGHASRAAWYLAGGELLLGLIVTVSVAAMTFPLLFIAAAVAGSVPGGVAVAGVHLVLCRQGPDEAAGIGPFCEDSSPRPSRSRMADVICMLVLLGLSVWAAWPVPAPPADAWMYGAAIPG